MRKLILLALLLTSFTNADSYSRAGDVVTNHTKSLQWQDQSYNSSELSVYNSTYRESGKAKKWIHASSYCHSLNLSGSGWRLPTLNELRTIVNSSYRDPALNPIFHARVGLGFWTSTRYGNDLANGIGFSSGRVHHCSINKKAKLIRCVRGGNAPVGSTEEGTTSPSSSSESVTTGGTTVDGVTTGGITTTTVVSSAGTTTTVTRGGTTHGGSCHGGHTYNGVTTGGTVYGGVTTGGITYTTTTEPSSTQNSISPTPLKKK